MHPWSPWRSLGGDDPWASFDCPDSKRWRYLPDGRVEIEGEGATTGSWTTAVDQWRELVMKHAAAFGIPPAWIAAIMSIESTGKPGQCKRLPGGACNTGEGIGLMAIMTATATSMAGRPVSAEDLLNDNDLNIELGTKYLKYQLDRYGGDPVKASVGYNAGGVRCGQGTVFGTRDESCPRTDWNVVEGCVRGPRSYSHLVCAPSSIVEGQYVCSIDRPRGFIKALNAAVGAGWPTGPVDPWVGPEPLPGPAEPDRRPISVGALLAFAGGMATGYLVVGAVRYGADVSSGRARLPVLLRRAH
jgi:hypothetical protein